MKRVICAAVLLGILAGLSGCFVWVKDDCESSNTEKTQPADSTFAEIDAVKMLSDDGARFDVLMAIAHRPNLSPQARVHLTQSLNLLSDDGARYDILMALAQNTPIPPQPPLPAQLQPQLPQPPQPPVNPQ